MAYGRMVSKTIATDPQLRQLSDKAAFLFISMIPFLDRQGKFYALPATVKGMVVPFRKSFTLDNVDSCLKEMENAGLVKIYGQEREYIIFKGFLNNNSVHKNEAESEIPDYFPDNSEEITSKLPVNSEKDTGQLPVNYGKNPVNVGLNRIERKGIERNETLPTEEISLEDLKPTVDQRREPFLKELTVLKGIVNYPSDEAKDVYMLEEIKKDYPTANMVKQLEKLKYWLIEHPIKMHRDGTVASNIRLRIKNWFMKGEEFKTEAKDSEKEVLKPGAKRMLNGKEQIWDGMSWSGYEQ